MDSFRIIISTRLKSNAVAKYLTELGTDVRFITLRRGEFLLADKFGIRYMPREDFIRAINSRVIYRDVLEMKREYAEPAIIVEGGDPFHDPGLGLSTAHGAMLFISVLNRIPILVTENEAETAQMLFMLAAQTSNGIDWKIAAAQADDARIRKAKVGSDPQVEIAERLPDVGPSLAKGLLKHFGSLRKLFSAQTADLQKVEGIGPKRAEKISAFLNGIKTT